MKAVGMMLLVVAMSLIFARAARRPASTPQSLPSSSSAVTAPAPADLDTCFSPEGHCDEKLVAFIRSATTSLDVAIFDLTHVQIAHELLVAAKRIPLRVLVDRRQARGPHSMVSLLVKAKANVRFGHQRGIMHNKFTIIDGKQVETGSYNYSEGATSKNNENQIYLRDPKVVGRYHERFETIWNEGTPVTPAALGLAAETEE